MKKLLVVMMILAVSLTFGQEFGLFGVAPTVGIIFPENLDMGLQVGAKAQVGSLMDGKVGLFPVVNYWRASDDDWDEFHFSNIKVGCDFHYDLAQFVSGLYAGAGLAMNIVKVEYEYEWPVWNGMSYTTEKKTYDDSESKFGFSVFAGYALEVAGKEAFVEATYDIIEDFNTFGVKGGLYFNMKK
ncbi:MAG: hypothetical protein JXQ65_16310 [Candidatus Marinimicrobia bacterium]|nr:hypothetical protein [Candidatus Neomarinimicrobiota bacterium]